MKLFLIPEYLLYGDLIPLCNIGNTLASAHPNVSLFMTFITLMFGYDSVLPSNPLLNFSCIFKHFP